ncbi:MAG: MFS transporter [Fimbriimonadaceae bacterium]|nr:MFS transporter [Fimbriimonadaceae bacterium]
MASRSYVDTWNWNARFAAYKFGQSFKWFCVLNVLGQKQTYAITGPGNANATWGLIVSLGAAWAAFGPAIFGDWSDRIRKRRGFVIAGMLLTLALLTGLAMANQVWMLFAGYFLVQVADDVAEGPYGGALPEVVPQEKRGFASSVIGQLSLSAQLVGGISMFFLASNLLAAYAVLAAVTIACSLITLQVLPEPNQTSTDRAKVPFWKGYTKPWASHDFRIVWTTRLMAATGAYVITVYLQNFFRDSYNRNADGTLTGWFNLQVPPESAVSLVLLMIATFGILGAIFAARRIDRWGRKPMMRGAGMSVAVLLIPFMFSRSLSLTMALAIGFGLVYGAYMSSEWALASDVMPDPEELSKDMGMWSSSGQFAQLIVGVTGGLIDGLNRGFGIPSGYMASVGIASVLFAGAAVLIGQIRGTR